MSLPQKLSMVVGVLLLAACAQQPPRDFQRPQRNSIAEYSLEGRISVRRGSDARQAGIAWQHDQGNDTIELSGPLGQHVARLVRDGSGARLDMASHESRVAPDWEALSEQVLGVALPLNNMALWLVGVFSADANIERDEAGRPLHVVVDGWRIDYLGYESTVADALPSLIELRRQDIGLRLKIDQWQLN